MPQSALCSVLQEGLPALLQTSFVKPLCGQPSPACELAGNILIRMAAPSLSGLLPLQGYHCACCWQAEPAIP